MLFVGGNTFSVDDLYGKPLHCVQGKWHYDTVHNALVFRRIWRMREEHVAIALPPLDVNATLYISYCWGHRTAFIGGHEVSVVLQWFKSGLA